MSITKEITAIINRYDNTGMDANQFNEIIEMRKHLAVLSYRLGMEVAKYKVSFDKAYAARKIAFFNEKNNAIDEGVTKAEAIAEGKISDLRTKEKELEGLYSGSKIILTQTNEVLKSMQQDLSILRNEIIE